MWGKLNLPMLLFRVGLLTLIDMDFFIFLAKLFPSLQCYLEVIVTGGVACLVAVMMNGWGGLQVLSVSFTKGPGGFPIYSSSQPSSPHWDQYMAPLWLTTGSLSLGRPGGFWWYCHFWSGLEWSIYHRSFWYFHKDLVYSVWQHGP